MYIFQHRPRLSISRCWLTISDTSSEQSEIRLIAEWQTWRMQMVDDPEKAIKLVREGRRSIFSLVPDWKKCLFIRKQVDDNLRRLLRKQKWKVDTIVTKDRKGTNILSDFLRDNPTFSKFRVTTDNRLDGRLIKGMSVIIYDDSIHTGDSILRTLKEIATHDPSNVAVACLLINKMAKKRILAKFPGIKIHTCFEAFDSYGAQRSKYLTFIIGYLDGIRERINPDYPAMKLVTDSRDPAKVHAVTVAALRSSLHIATVSQVKSHANRRNSLSLTFDLKTGKLPPTPFDSISEKDTAPKLRCTIAKYDNQSEITILPIISPRFTLERCRVDSRHPNLCQYKLKKMKRRSNITCGICLPFTVNWLLLVYLKPKLISHLKKNGIAVDKVKYEAPSSGRFVPH